MITTKIKLNVFLIFIIGFLSVSVSFAAIDVDVNLSGTGASGSTSSTKVFIERIELSFPNNRPSQTVSLQTPGFYATARFKYLGNGPLSIRWLVDGRVVSQTTEILSFGKEVTIRSDKNNVYLPTFQRGNHVVSVQLSNSSGVIDLASRTIRYFVTDGVAEFKPDGEIKVMYPKDRLVDPLNFYFRWKGLNNFQAYLIEVERLATKAVSSATVMKALSKLDVFAPSDKQRSDLIAGEYRWRVKGLYTDRKNPPLYSQWAAFTVSENKKNEGGIFINQVTAKDINPLQSAQLRIFQSTQQDIPSSKTLLNKKFVIGEGKISAGNPYQLQIDIQNTGDSDRDDLMVDIRDKGGLVGRYPITVAAGKSASVSIPLESSAVSSTSLENLSIQVIAGNSTVDEAAINLTVEPKIRLDDISFTEVKGATSGSFPIGDPWGCGRGTSPDRDLAFSRIISAKNLSQPNASEQSILERGYFHFDQDEEVKFTFYFKDNDMGDWFQASANACNTNILLPGDRLVLENQRDSLVQQIQTCRSNNIGGDIVKACGSIISSLRSVVTTLAQADAALGNISIPLKLIAYPLDSAGQVSGDAIVIGSVAIEKGFDGLIVGPQWRIPQSGQYKISLNDIGDQADLYATLPGGFPRYIHAAGFVLDVQQIADSSSITSQQSNQQLRQAIVTGAATTRWLGDVNNNQLLLDLDKISIEMSNPLHANLIGGVIDLLRTDNSLIPKLRLYQQDYELLDLSLSLSGARADLNYQLPDGYQRNSSPMLARTFKGAGVSTILPSRLSREVEASQATILTAFTPQATPSSATNLAASTGRALTAEATNNSLGTLLQSLSNAGELIHFIDVDVLNGGEFVAQFDFNNSWADRKLKGDNLALRLKGSTLVIDTSPHLSYTNYTPQARFTGVGIHNGYLRVKVNTSNDLFSVSNADNAFIYGKANWLSFDSNGLSGEEIEVIPGSAIASFFSQTADENLTLIQPFGFSLRIDGGIFKLQDSKVGGVDFSGSVTLPQTDSSSVTSISSIDFQHLSRRQTSDVNVPPTFTTERIQLANQHFEMGVFDYQPDIARFNIGDSQIQFEPSPASPQNMAQMEYRELDQWQDLLYPALNNRAGLLLSNGSLAKDWERIGDDSSTQINVIPRGVFLVNQAGLQGQWAEIRDPQHYRINGFDTKLSGLWLKFEDSALIDSTASGLLNIPYPVQQSFGFDGTMTQEAEIQIAPNALKMPQQATTDGYFDLPYWRARLSLPAPQLSSVPQAGLVQTKATGSRSQIQIAPPLVSPLIFDAENQRIKLTDIGLSLVVDEDKGGEEFITGNEAAPFTIDTFILPTGQLTDTSISSSGELYFVGQRFEPDSLDAIHFLPYFGNHQAPDDDAVASAQPLLEITGEVNFSVFGPQQVTIHHTAMGARVPVIKRAPDVDIFWGDGIVRVNADLKFVNSFAINPSNLNGLVNASSASTTPASSDPEAFKAFVGKADLVIIDAVSIKGLAEAGLHYAQELDEQGNWLPPSDTQPENQVAYERIGLGAGADLLKATLAGVRGMETATELGGAVISGITGVEGTGQQLVDLGVDAVTFVESLALATGIGIASGGAAAAEEIRHAIDNGLATTNSGIELLRTICQQDSDCTPDTAMQLDIGSLLVRTTGSITHFDELSPEELASISLQTMDIGIPILQGVDLDQAMSRAGVDNLPVTLNDKKDAALSTAHAVVGAARTIVDKNGRITFNDFINISRRSVKAARDMSQISEVRAIMNPANEDFIDLSIGLAEASIDMVQDLSAGDQLTQLSDITSQYMRLLCEQSDQLGPLFRAAGLPAESDHLIKTMMNNSNAVLSKLSSEGLPAGSEEVVSQFLVSILETMAEGAPTIPGCSVPSSAEAPLVQAMLKVAAHSLKPMTGALTDEGKQIAWALEGVSLSLDATESLATQLKLAVPVETSQIKQVLSRLKNTFETLNNDLDDVDQIAKAQTILRLAKGIPEAFDDILQSASSQASELMGVYLVLMTELEKLLPQAGAIASDNLVDVDFYSLPLAMINEAQDLSLLNQCQKFGLANMAHVLSLGREMSATTPLLSTFVDKAKIIHANIKQCDPTGISTAPEVDQLMAMLDLAGSVVDNNQQPLALVKNALPQLLPLFVEKSAVMIDATQALVTALPIVDFTRDDLATTLDSTLNRLLAEAELKTTDADAIRSIRRSRSIINHANLKMAGVSITKDAAGKVITMKHLRADGSYRIIGFNVGGAQQFYPEGHPDYVGGLEEKWISSELLFEYESLADEYKQSLFTDYWNDLIEGGNLSVRKYKDADKNRIVVDTTLGTIGVEIINAVSYGNFTPNRRITVAHVPGRGTAASDIDADIVNILAIAAYREYNPPNNPACVFSGGCSYSVQGSNPLTVRSISNPQHYVSYPGRENAQYELQDLESTEDLFEFKGYINDVNGWNPHWYVNYRSGDLLELSRGQSTEKISLGYSSIGDIQEIPALLDGIEIFKQRTVVSGTDIWNYIPGGKATHRFGNGQWVIYNMPENLPVGTAIPAPDQSFDPVPASFELLARGDENGITENPAGLAQSTNDQGESVLTIPAASSDDVITIALSGTDTGEVMIGDVDMVVAAESGVTASEVASTEMQESGNQLIQMNDGSTVQIQGANEDNLKITRTSYSVTGENEQGQSTSVNHRTVQIQYCEDADISWASCPTQQQFDQAFDYVWLTDYSSDQSYIDLDLSQRPVITPASGINASIKHQKWIEIFALEQTLLQQPTETGLQQLEQLFDEAEALGLPANELIEQNHTISARIINLLVIKYFNEFDSAADDLSKMQYWQQNPSASPYRKINSLLDSLVQTGFTPDINFFSRYQEILHLTYRLYLHDLGGLQIGDSNLQLTADLSNKLSNLLDIMGLMQNLGDESQTAYDFGFACDAIQRVRNYIQIEIFDNSDYVPLNSDFTMIMNIESSGESLGCEGSDTLFAEISELFSGSNSNENASYHETLQTVRFRRLGEAILRQDSALDNYNHDNTLNTQDVIYYYLNSIMEVDPLANLQPPTVENYQAWIQHILNVDRLIKEINGERARRDAIQDETPKFYSADVVTFKNSLIALLKQSWESLYRTRFDQFVSTAQTTSLVDLKALAKHYESYSSINTRLARIGIDPVIEVDTSHYLKVKLANDWLSPLPQMTTRQTDWLNGIWLQSAVDNPAMQLIAGQLVEQDGLMQFLLDSLPGDQLPGIQRYEARVNDKIITQMDAVSSALAGYQGTADGLVPLVEPITAIDQFLTFFQLIDSQALLQSRVQQLLDQAVNRVKNDYSTTLPELRIIVAVSTARTGTSSSVFGGLEDNESVRAAIHEAGTNALYVVSSGGDSEDIEDFLAIVAIEQNLGFSDPEWSISDVFTRMLEIVEDAKTALIASNDISKINDYLDAMAQAQLLGIDSNMEFDPVINVLESHINNLSACETTQNCTITHIRTYIEYYAALVGLGYEGQDIGLAEVESMAESSPVTMAESLRHDKELPNLKNIVLGDKTGNVGRLAAARSLEGIGNQLPIGDVAGRTAIRGVIVRLKSLAGLTLPAGSAKPVPADDPLLQSANNLQQKIDSWVEMVSEQMITIQDSNNGQMLSGSLEDVTASLGISEEELNSVVLPEINGTTGDVRIVPGNKYRLAAEALANITNRETEAWRELSYQLMQNLPDPEITAEGDYRLSAITQLTGFILKRAGQLTVDSFDAESLKQHATGDVIFTLLNLPAEQQPVQKLAELIETRLLAPLVTGDDAALQCSEGVLPCILGSSLQFVGVALDSMISGVQTANAASPAAAKDPKILAGFMAEQLALRLSGLSDSGDPDDFWLGLAGEGLSISLKALKQGADLEKEVVIGGLAVAQKIFKYQPVMNLIKTMVQPVPMAFYFVRDASEFLSDSLNESPDKHLPVAIARLTNNALTETIGQVDQNLAKFSDTLITWQLDFADTNWTLIEAAIGGTVKAEDWLNALIKAQGVATLNCRINELNLLDNVQVPAALVMTPFMSASSLLNNENFPSTPPESSKVLVDLAADLSNVWFTPLSGNCDEISIPAEDQALAKLIRPLKTIDFSKKPDLIGLQLVGNLAIGAMNTLLTSDTPFSAVMNLLWTGDADQASAGISNFLTLAMAGETQNLSTLYQQIETIPLTVTKMVEVMVDNPNDPTAKTLRLLSGNTLPGDLLDPDQFIEGDVYKIPNSLLAILGEVRKAYTPDDVSDYVNDDVWGYLKTMPFIEFDNNAFKIIDAEAYQAALAEILSMAADLNPQGAIAGVQDAVSTGLSDFRTGLQSVAGEAGNTVAGAPLNAKKAIVAAIDIARMGTSAIGILLVPNQDGQLAVAGIQQQAIFNELAGAGAGFSGVSGGLQREWPKGSEDFGNLTVEMYGQLVFPFMGRQVGLMQLITVTNENNSQRTSHLHFEAAQQTEGVGDFVGGLTGAMTANLSLGSDGTLGLEYQGTMDLSILSNTIAGASVSGLIHDFEVPNRENFNPADYLVRQAQNIDILQCASLTSQVLPFPLSLTGVGATATIAGFAEKKDLGLMIGARVGLSGNLNVPVLTSLLGIELGGTLTAGYQADYVPNQNLTAALSSCVSPDITLTVLGQRIPVSGAEVRVEAFVEAGLEAGNDSIATGIKLEVGLDAEIMTAFSDELGCRATGFSAESVGDFFGNPTKAVVTSAAASVMCPLIGISQPSLWVVLRNVSVTQNEIMIGLGELPTNNALNPFIKVEVNPINQSFGIGLTKQVGGWGGWNGSDNIELCNANLCEMDL